MYPLRFRPIFKRRIWGGRRLLDIKKGQYPRTVKNERYGESWDISCLDRDVSVVSNGFLKGNNLRELIEVYMGDLVGDSVFEEYGTEFPLLFKYLDCDDVLSVQVHPDDEIAAERHEASGKNEMWYVVSAEPGAKIYIGFRDSGISREEFIRAIAEGRVGEIIQPVDVKAGDAFFIQAGTVHALSKGVTVVEIQQSSDLTYRIFDWNRVDAEGRSRELHTALAIDAVDFGLTAETSRINYKAEADSAVQLVKCNHFTVNLIDVESELVRDYCGLDSFVAYVCVEGSVSLDADGNSDRLSAGEVILIPAEVNEVSLSGKGRILECHM